jgi:hypothetical protein
MNLYNRDSLTVNYVQSIYFTFGIAISVRDMDDHESNLPTLSPRHQTYRSPSLA